MNDWLIELNKVNENNNLRLKILKNLSRTLISDGKILTPEEAKHVRDLMATKEAQESGVALTPAQEKVKKEKIEKRDKVIELFSLADRMEEAINKGAKVGPGIDILNRLSPNLLAQQFGEETAELGRLSAELINAKGENIKGIMNKSRQCLLERSKVGLDKSEEVNRRALKEIKDTAIRKYKEMVKDDPFLSLPEIDEKINKQTLPPLTAAKAPLTAAKANQIIKTEFKDHPANKLDEGDEGESDEGYMFVVKNGRWVPKMNRG